MVTAVHLLWGLSVPGQLIPEGTRAVVFRQIYVVFLVLGTLVGIVVIAYMLIKAYRYRESANKGADMDRPELGELPTGSGGGRKLFLSFSLSAIIVVSLISWTYFTLLYVENPEPVQDEEPLEIKVIGHQFFWEFVYPNGESVRGELVVPEDRQVRLTVTSADVFHNFGIPELRAKTDAIPGQETSTWFVADERGTYQANCYELCGGGHSHMTGTVKVVSESKYEEWYDNMTNESENETDDGGNESVGEEAAESAIVADASASAAGGTHARVSAPSVATPAAAPGERVAATDGGVIA